ncbi:MAG: hypothetical protein KKF62_07490 [Bacteroidetes bacterium]|nr:hypothetical protein [Bacteroidota bacterium]MBU1116566.1 hypothetical protein [Bacteroidota bacterium]MBU1797544.1 hypothetical protein [Bacteroidota bacterium]
MELLPIIYWSLLGVGLLALIVILFSFITFKFRKKLGNIPSTEVKGKERNKRIVVKNPEKLQAEKKHHPKVQTRSKQKAGTTNSKSKSSSDENIGLYKKPTRETPKKRVEILNQNMDDNSSMKKPVNKDTKFHSIKIESKQDGWN